MIKIFQKIFVGITAKSQHHLAFMTPYEDNKAGATRINTVKSWLTQKEHYYSPGESSLTTTFDNTPRAGFYILKEQRRTYYGGGNVVWQVYDPIGCVVEISSHNLAILISDCGIELGGLIPGKCIWGRDGSQNVLLHEDSPEYKNTINVDTQNEVKVPAKGKVKGGKYTYNHIPCVYLGKVYVADIETYGTRTNVKSEDGVALIQRVQNVTASENALEALLIEGVIKLYKSSVKLSNFSGMYELPVNDELFEKFGCSYASYSNTSVLSISTSKFENFELVFKPFELNDSQIMRISGLKNNDTLVHFHCSYSLVPTIGCMDVGGFLAGVVSKNHNSDGNKVFGCEIHGKSFIHYDYEYSSPYRMTPTVHDKLKRNLQIDAISKHQFYKLMAKHA